MVIFNDVILLFKAFFTHLLPPWVSVKKNENPTGCGIFLSIQSIDYGKQICIKKVWKSDIPVKFHCIVCGSRSNQK